MGNATSFEANLSAPERDALAVLALANRDLRPAEWAQLLELVGVSTRPGKGKMRASDIKAACSRFQEMGLVTRSGGTGVAVRHGIHPAALFTALIDAAKRGRLEELDRRLLGTTTGYSSGYSTDDGYYGFNDGRYGRYGDYGGYDRYPLERESTKLRVGLVLGDMERAAAAAEAAERSLNYGKNGRAEFGIWLVSALGTRPADDWVRALGTLADVYLEALYHAAAAQLAAIEPRLARLGDEHPKTHGALAYYLALRGEDTGHVTTPKTQDTIALVSAFCRGDHAGAISSGAAAVAAMSKNRKHKQLRGIEGVLHALSRMTAGDAQPREWTALGRAATNAKAAKAGHPLAYDALSTLHRAATEGRQPSETQLLMASGYYDGSLTYAPWAEVLAVALVHAWADHPGDWLLPTLGDWVRRTEAWGFDGIHREFAAVHGALEGSGAPAEGTLTTAYRPSEPWEIALGALEVVAEEPAPAGARGPSAQAEKHIVWEVALGRHEVDIKARIAGGRAKKGKDVSLARLLEGKVPCVSEHDRRILAAADYVETYRSRRKKQPVLRWRALLELIGHPHVIRPTGAPVELTRGEPRLIVETKANVLHITLQPPELTTQPVAIEEHDPGHVSVYERDPRIERVAEALGSKGELKVPTSARERVGKVLAGLAGSLAVSASADIQIAGEERAADPRVVVVLHWDGTSLSARVRTAPLGVEGPLVPVGGGGPTVTATFDGQPVHTVRDFEAEEASLESLYRLCPLFAALTEHTREAQTDELTVALEALVELDAMGEEVVLAWPKGKRLATPVSRGVDDLRVRMREAGEWLTTDGGLVVDEDLVVGFQDLLRNRRGRFVALTDARFVALTDTLARRLDALDAVTKAQKKGLVSNVVTLSLLEELLEGACEVKVDAKVSQRRAKLEGAASLTPRKPRAFSGELRDYQREGYVWMSRLAEAGLGACLADDMGLGKTIQALALLVSRAKHGPALVVAPTSVAANWLDEAARFAPTLTCHALSEGDRDATLASLGPKHVLVCSYGLLASETERLSKVTFDTVVFDEAHLLKNSLTKRAKAARALTAEFRLSLTGTPLENHIGELYSLMEATVPGLLGSRKRFQTRFEVPIRDGDREAAKQLRAMLRPFLLRRTKTEVLDELPPRTEVTVRIETTPEAQAYYEAMRQNAHAVLESVDDGGGRLQVLAEITRLRQAAVDPRLIDSAAPAGAKVDAAVARIVALREEGHRVLVFTQFLTSIDLVLRALDDADVSHLTLDGSTPAKERARRIDAFQDGEADVFVMSLKAGGVGINLTGADYVIHLDPWWNPAVEDQATSRAHRIGQDRPVTVYRFVTAGTIEEKILELHHHKRDMAEQLLENMSKAKKLDIAELRALL
ncbi:MAG: DEAD/DEAH box helicase [Deltaproteobacteria bacterium]|nr:DEAD/DEAH box helicase [Deltaproteobacteria bacterium]